MEDNQQTYQDTEMQDPPVKKLYDGLFKTKRYTKSFDEFKKQYSTKESIAKLHTGLSNSQSYTKGEDEFVNQYFPEVKKKEDTPSQPLATPSPLPSARELASKNISRDNTRPVAQMQQAQVTAPKEVKYIQEVLPIKKKEAQEKREATALANQKNVVPDNFNAEEFLQNDIETEGKNAIEFVENEKQNFKKVIGVGGKKVDDAISLKMYYQKRNEEIQEAKKSIDRKLAALKEEKIGNKRGDLSSSYKPIVDPKFAIKEEIPQDEKSLMDEWQTLNEKGKNLSRAIDYFAKKQAATISKGGTLKEASHAYRFLTNDETLDKQQGYEEKGIPIKDEDKLNDDFIGLMVRENELDENRASGKITEEEYNDTKFNIDEQRKYAVNKYPELRSKRIGLLVAQELGASSRDAILAASMGDEKALKLIADKTGLSKKDLSFLKYGDIVNETFGGNIAGRITDAATSLVTGGLRLANNAIGIDEDRLSYVNEKIGGLGVGLFGSNPYEQTQASQTLIGKDLQEYQNPNAGKYNYNAATIKNFAGNAIGGLIGFIGGTKGLGALGMGERAALWTNVITSEYEPNYQLASEVMGKDASEEQKNLYALGIGAIHAAAFEFIPHSAKQKLGFAKVEQNAAKEFKQILGTKSIKEVDRELLKGWVEKTIESIAKSSGEAAKVVAATKGGSVASHIVNAMVGEDEYQKQNFDELASEFEPNKIGEEVIGLALPLGLIGIPQGVKNSRQYKEGLYDAGLHPESYKTVLKQMVGDGRITEKEAEQRGEVIDVMANLQKSIPDINPSTNQRLTHSQKVEYAYNRAKEIALKAKKEEIKDDVALSQFYDRNAKELVEERKSIIDGTHNEYLETVDLHQRILDTGKHNTTLNAGTKTDGVKYLQEQSLTTPNGTKNSLNGDVELTTDLIARNEPTKIKAEIKDLKETHKKLIENEKKQEANEVQKNIDLLEQGLEKTKKPIVEEVDTKLSVPIEGVNEQGVPIGENVPPPVEVIGEGKVVGSDLADMTNDINIEIKQNKIEGGLLNEQQALELKKEIESKYNNGVQKFGQESNDIRENLYNYDNPLAEKDINGVNIRIAGGLVEGEPYSEKRRKTYLLYADGKIVGKFYSVPDAKSVVKIIEDNLVKSIGNGKEAAPKIVEKSENDKSIELLETLTESASDKFKEVYDEKDFNNLQKLSKKIATDLYDNYLNENNIPKDERKFDNEGDLDMIEQLSTRIISAADKKYAPKRTSVNAAELIKKAYSSKGSGVGGDVKEPMGDNELQQIVGRDVFKQIQRSEEQLGEGVVDRNRMIETAKQIQKADKKDKLLPEHIFEALQYETGYPDNWQDLRNAIKKGGIDINSEAVQRQIEVGVDLPKDIVEEFKKSERYKNATPELVKAVEQSLPTQEGKVEQPSLSNVVVDEKLNSWNNYKIGDEISASELPNNTHGVDGNFKLQVIPIENTDFQIKGRTREDLLKSSDDVKGDSEWMDKIKANFDGKEREPIEVTISKDGVYHILDGSHRVTIAKELGRKSILAFVKDEQPSDIKDYVFKDVKAVEPSKPQPSNVVEGKGSGVGGDVDATAKALEDWTNNDIDVFFGIRDKVKVQRENNLELEKIKADAKNNGTFLKAPNGNKSKLSENDWATVRTNDFKKRFGDWTKKDTDIILDDNGEPMKVYHGTAFNPKKGMFKDFDTEKNKYGYIFFTDNLDAAKEWARDRETYGNSERHVVESFIKIKNPEIKDYKGEILPDSAIGSFKTKNEDGFILKDVIDTAEGKPIVNTVYAVKNKEQVSPLNINGNNRNLSAKEIAEAYHKAKKDGTNPELVKAVEQSLPTQAEAKKGAEGSGVGGDVKHRQNIHDKFREQFSKKGVPDEQITGALALMDARAKSAVSNGEVKTSEEWYNRIADVKSGEFETSDINFQWDKNFPKVIQQTNGVTLKGHPEYAKAKSGNSAAAVKVVNDIVKADKITEILDGNEDAIIVPVLSVEEKGNNKLPLAYAQKIAKEGSGKIAKIFQTNKTKHTGADAMHRVMATPKFTGRVSKGKTYILVDDVVTSGSTVRALKEYIENKGGKVKLVTSLATASNAQTGWGGDLAIKPETAKAIREKFNTNQLNLLLSQYGIAEKYTDLTNSQAKYILSHRGIDGLRTKFNDARLREVSTRNGNTSDGIRGNRVKFQQLTEGSLPKGAVETLADGKVVIHALNSPDFSTMVHEIAHVFEGDLTAAEQKTVKDFGGSEPFARGFEKYLRDGKAPTAELKTLFDKFKDWLTDIYKTLKGSPIEKRVTPEIKQIFDRLLTEKEQSLPTQEGKVEQPIKPEIAKLEAERDAEIDEVVKPKLDIEFIDNGDVALNKLTGQDRVKATKKGKTITTKESFRDIQNDLRKMKSNLEKLINC